MAAVKGAPKEEQLDQQSTTELHRSLNLAGFRALATAAGLLQLCRELQASGVLTSDGVDRIKAAVHGELMEQVPRSLIGNASFASRLRERLDRLFAGTASLTDEPVLPPKDDRP